MQQLFRYIAHALWIRALWGGVSIALLGAILIIYANHWQIRWDLTADKRYTLSAAGEALLSELESPLHIEVYLSGELPAGFRRLQKNTLSLLHILSRRSPYVKVRLIAPTHAEGRAQQAYFRTLANKGIQPTRLSYKSKDGENTRWIFPGAMLNYQGREQGIMLLSGKGGDALEQSVMDLEYQILQGIASVLRTSHRRIGIVGEVSNYMNKKQLQRQLAKDYMLLSLDIAQPISAEQYPVLFVFSSQVNWGDVEKYHLDQYIMNGGKVLFFIGGVKMPLEGVSGEGILAYPTTGGVDDLLFHYGIRVKKQLIEDLYCAPYPVIAGENTQIQMVPWPFYIVGHQFGTHPTAYNIQSTLLRYASPLDTVYAENIVKTPLLYSSTHTRTAVYPQQVGLSLIQKGVEAKDFGKKQHILAYALSGRFASAYKNRVPPTQADPFVGQQTQKGHLFVFGSPYFLYNDLHPRSNEALDIGYYWPSSQQYGNLDMVKQVLEYCFSPQGLIVGRKRALILRPLDKIRTKKEAPFWQYLNICLPLGIWLVGGGIVWVVRQKLYTKKYAGTKNRNE